MLQIEPIFVDIKTAYRMLGIGRTTLFDLLAEERLDRKKLGRKTLVTMASIRAFAEELV